MFSFCFFISLAYTYCVETQPVPAKTLLGEYGISRYYTVVPNQTRYYLNKTFENDFKMNCSWDCFITANGHKLTDNQWGRVVACPKDIKLGSRLLIDGIWEVTCHDRWWAIKNKRLDVWMWVGDAGVNRIYAKATTYHGKRKVYLLR